MNYDARKYLTEIECEWLDSFIDKIKDSNINIEKIRFAYNPHLKEIDNRINAVNLVCNVKIPYSSEKNSYRFQITNRLDLLCTSEIPFDKTSYINDRLNEISKHNKSIDSENLICDYGNSISLSIQEFKNKLYNHSLSNEGLRLWKSTNTHLDENEFRKWKRMLNLSYKNYHAYEWNKENIKNSILIAKNNLVIKDNQIELNVPSINGEFGYPILKTVFNKSQIKYHEYKNYYKVDISQLDNKINIDELGVTPLGYTKIRTIQIHKDDFIFRFENNNIINEKLEKKLIKDKIYANERIEELDFDSFKEWIKEDKGQEM